MLKLAYGILCFAPFGSAGAVMALAATEPAATEGWVATGITASLVGVLCWALKRLIDQRDRSEANTRALVSTVARLADRFARCECMKDAEGASAVKSARAEVEKQEGGAEC